MGLARSVSRVERWRRHHRKGCTLKKALIVVDVQNDFCEGGALGVDGGNNVARSISSWLEDHGSEYDLVVATRDWHHADTDNTGHFAESPDFLDSWPAHCVAGTHGAEFHPELWPAGGAYPHVEVRKGQGMPAYSGFEGTTADGRTLCDLLRDAGVKEVDVVGIAFDYCVRATAIDAVVCGMKTNVLRDLTAAIHPNGAAEDEMTAAGVTVSDSPAGESGHEDL